MKSSKSKSRSVKTNKSMEDTVSGMAGNKPTTAIDVQSAVLKTIDNPVLEEFEALIDSIKRDIRVVADFRKSINDDDPSTISKYTDEEIKRGLRSSRWA